MGTGSHRSIKLRRPQQHQETTGEYVRLFLAVLLLFALQASMGETILATVLQIIVGGVALILALRVADAPARVQRYVGLLVLLAVVAALVQLVQGKDQPANGLLLLVNGVLVAAGPFVIFGGLRRHPTISIRTLIAALTIYVLLGLFFAFVYRAFIQFDASSFESAHDLTPAAMQYYSFITITTVGYGDITPVGELARTVAALEALIGQVYLVTVVALVVANIGAERIAARTRIERGADDE